MLLQINDGMMDFAGDILFENANIEIKEGRKMAIIGRNGCGKTTLLKIISGQESLSKGTITKAKGVTVGYLSQQAFPDESLTVQQEFDKVYQRIIAVKEQMELIEQRLATSYDEELLQEYARLESIFVANNGYNYDQEQMILFTKFGFSFEDLERPLSTFSGGQKTRIAFVKLLLEEPDVLLLDEPTNHLDIRGIEWVEC